MQVGTNVQVGKFLKINKRAGCNKAVQVGIFQKSIVKKCPKLLNVQVGIFQKINLLYDYLGG